MNKNMRLGMVGSVPPPIGGVTILFENLLKGLSEFQEIKVETVLIPVGSGNIFNKIRNVFIVIIRVLQIIRKIDILTLHVPTLVLPILAPLCFVIAKLYKKTFLLRKFGGTDYRQFKWISRLLSIYVVNRSDVYLAEAKALVDIAKEHGAKRALWYPNNRPTDSIEIDLSKRDCQRFVYIGQIRNVKGVMEIAQAAELLELIKPVDIYGPFYDGITEETFKKYKNVSYKGIIKPKDVIPTLTNYDALLLPTYHDGEGYPGVIFEAYCAGVPVICTKWKFLPEIVDESSGLLIAPRDVEELRIAMNMLQTNNKFYNKLREGAYKKALLFSADVWVQKFVEICHSI